MGLLDPLRVGRAFLCPNVPADTGPWLRPVCWSWQPCVKNILKKQALPRTTFQKAKTPFLSTFGRGGRRNRGGLVAKGTESWCDKCLISVRYVPNHDEIDA